jgi:hypothetical protein
MSFKGSDFATGSGQQQPVKVRNDTDKLKYL